MIHINRLIALTENFLKGLHLTAVICRLTAYDWAALCLGAACVLDFFSGGIAKLHIVYHDDVAANFKPWSNHYAF